MAVSSKQILVVDDEEKLLETIARRLSVLGFVPLTATSGMAAIGVIAKHSVDVAIVDLQMPDMNGLITITKLKEIQPDLKTILLTGHGSSKLKQATESLNTLYFEKENMGRFWRFIKKLNADGPIVNIKPGAASDAPKPFQRVNRSASQTDHPESSDRPRIVGETPAMQKLRKKIEYFAPLACSVTLCGEPGSGRELAARAIHAGSLRHHQRFLVLNCSDFAANRLAGQILGCHDGRLREAIQSRSGIFNTRDLGTILFDDVEKMPFPMQDQLIELLDASNNPSAEGQQKPPLDVRILVTAAADLPQHVRNDSFSKDLYERLKVFQLSIPPLRERRDDIPPLCRYFLDKYRRELKKPVDAIASNVVKTLVAYDFPGNVRELEYIIERAVILAEGATIEHQHLPQRFLDKTQSLRRLETPNLSTLAVVEKNYILEVLKALNGNKSRTAEMLGISRAALWRKLKQFRTEASE